MATVACLALGVGAPLVASSVETAAFEKKVAARNSVAASEIAECAGLDADSKFVSAHIKNAGSETSLRFPYDYLVPLGFVDGGVREAIVFQVHGDTFKPFTRAQENAPEQKKRFKEGYRDASTVLVNMISPDRVNTSVHNIAIALLELYYGSGAKLDGPVLPNGLTRQSERPQLGQDLFLGKRNGRVTDVISCSIPGRVPSPNCMQRFRLENMSVSTSYPRYKLNEWESFRDRSIALLSCFRQLTK
nr:hypothetical protein [Rhizobium sp. ACO-34A]